ncbi:Sigma-54-dependent Fis family transcriptional regulator OS=Stutzerimonas stutzeri OX=316 GN=CXK95_11170 PE=4 SV=1 [Stutzerimonas stutzeri]
MRVIAATHIDLEAKVAAGQFRDDLYYRLNVLALRVPPLRERSGDIPAVIEHLLDDIANRSGQPPMELSPQALALLCAQPWRGNVRELGNLLERAQLCTDGPQLEVEHLLPLLGEQASPASSAAPAAPSRPAVPSEPASVDEDLPLQPLAQTLAHAERRALQSALRACHGNRRRAAMELGISRASFYSKLAQHGLSQRLAVASRTRVLPDLSFCSGWQYPSPLGSDDDD